MGVVMFRKNFIPILVLLFICIFIVQPGTVSEGAFNGLKIWLVNIVPYLFPMSVLSNILLQYNFLYALFERTAFISEKMLKNKYALIPFFISFVSGYPSGAMTVSTMAGLNKINEKEANYLTAFSNVCSFQFIAGAVSFSMLGDFKLYKYIAVSHFAGALLLTALMKAPQPSSSSSKKMKLNYVGFHKAFSTAIYKSVSGILSVGGVIVIFSVFSNFLNHSLSSAAGVLSLSSVVKDIVYSLLVGVLEITNGCSIIASSVALPLSVKIVIINFLISFSGMSVIFQTVAVTNEFDFDINGYIFYKFVHGVISVLVCILMLSVFPIKIY